MSEVKAEDAQKQAQPEIKREAPMQAPPTPVVNLAFFHASEAIPLLNTPKAHDLPLLSSIESLRMPYLKVPVHVRVCDMKRYVSTKLRRNVVATAVTARQALIASQELESPHVGAPDVHSAEKKKGCDYPDVKDVDIFIVVRGSLREFTDAEQTIGNICEKDWDRQGALVLYYVAHWTHVVKAPEDDGYDLIALTAGIKDPKDTAIPWLQGRLNFLLDIAKKDAKRLLEGGGLQGDSKKPKLDGPLFTGLSDVTKGPSTAATPAAGKSTGGAPPPAQNSTNPAPPK